MVKEAPTKYIYKVLANFVLSSSGGWYIHRIIAYYCYQWLVVAMLDALLHGVVVLAHISLGSAWLWSVTPNKGLCSRWQAKANDGSSRWGSNSPTVVKVNELWLWIKHASNRTGSRRSYIFETVIHAIRNQWHLAEEFWEWGWFVPKHKLSVSPVLGRKSKMKGQPAKTDCDKSTRVKAPVLTNSRRKGIFLRHVTGTV